MFILDGGCGVQRGREEGVGLGKGTPGRSPCAREVERGLADGPPLAEGGGEEGGEPFEEFVEAPGPEAAEDEDDGAEGEAEAEPAAGAFGAELSVGGVVVGLEVLVGGGEEANADCFGEEVLEEGPETGVGGKWKCSFRIGGTQDMYDRLPQQLGYNHAAITMPSCFNSIRDCVTYQPNRVHQREGEVKNSHEEGEAARHPRKEYPVR